MENNKETKKMSTWKKVGIVVGSAAVVAVAYCVGKHGVKGTANLATAQVKNFAGRFSTPKSDAAPAATQENPVNNRPANNNWEKRENNRNQFNNNKFNN